MSKWRQASPKLKDVTEVVAERWMGTTTRYRGREGDGSWVYRVDVESVDRDEKDSFVDEN